MVAPHIDGVDTVYHWTFDNTLVDTVVGTALSPFAGGGTFVASPLGQQIELSIPGALYSHSFGGGVPFSQITVGGLFESDVIGGGASQLWSVASGSTYLGFILRNDRGINIHVITPFGAAVLMSPAGVFEWNTRTHFCVSRNSTTGVVLFVVGGVEISLVGSGPIGNLLMTDITVGTGFVTRRQDDLWLANTAWSVEQMLAEFTAVAGELELGGPWGGSGVTPRSPTDVDVEEGAYIEQTVDVPLGEYVLFALAGTRNPTGPSWELYDRASGDAAPGTLLTNSDFDNLSINTPPRTSPRVLSIRTRQIASGTSSKTTYVLYRVPLTGDAQAGTLTSRVFRLQFTSVGQVAGLQFNAYAPDQQALFYALTTGVPAEEETYSQETGAGPVILENRRTALAHILGTITPDWQFKDLDFGAAALEKLIEKYELSVQVDREMTVTGSFLKSRGAQGLATGTKALAPLGFLLGSGVLGTDALADGPDDAAIYPTLRQITKSVQPRLQFSYGKARLYELGVRVRPIGRRTSK